MLLGYSLHTNDSRKIICVCFLLQIYRTNPPEHVTISRKGSEANTLLFDGSRTMCFRDLYVGVSSDRGIQWMRMARADVAKNTPSNKRLTGAVSMHDCWGSVLNAMAQHVIKRMNLPWWSNVRAKAVTLDSSGGYANKSEDEEVVRFLKGRQEKIRVAMDGKVFGPCLTDEAIERISVENLVSGEYCPDGPCDGNDSGCEDKEEVARTVATVNGGDVSEASKTAESVRIEALNGRRINNTDGANVGVSNQGSAGVVNSDNNANSKQPVSAGGVGGDPPGARGAGEASSNVEEGGGVIKLKVGLFSRAPYPHPMAPKTMYKPTRHVKTENVVYYRLKHALKERERLWRENATEDGVQEQLRLRGSSLRKEKVDSQSKGGSVRFIYNITMINMGRMPLEEGMEVASTLDMIIGVHGAAFTHNIYTRPHVGLVEFFGGDRGPANRHPQNIAAMGHHPYGWGKKGNRRQDGGSIRE
eukprot:GHVU01112653.1.p1 GENE.GHVU01112653.1~~GHVU01112653.1.p1  ORF type:complete len:472 (+),score=34.30 GHVU01112653.1:31-1446(+)